MIRFLPILFLLCDYAAGAGTGNHKAKGVKMELSLGLPALTITNPDSTKAHYKGFDGSAKGFIPLVAKDSFHFYLTGGMRLMDLDNTANGKQSEYARYMGPSLGLELGVSRFFIGADYVYFKARHTASGPYSNKVEFDLTGLNIYGGVRMDFGTGSFGVAMSQMTSKIAGADVGLTGDSKWNNQTIWLQFTYNFKAEAGDFIKALFSK